MINFLKRQKIQFYILLGILILGAVLRFYNYPYRYSLGEETVRDAVIGIEGARELQFPLTGSFSSLGPFTFGPWYAYQLIIFYFLVPFVYSPWIYLSLISVAYILIMYKIGKILGREFFGLVLAFLVAISPAQIISATHLTSHNNTNLFAALSILIFLKLISRNKTTWLSLLFGFTIGVGMNLHFQMSGLLILPMLLLIYKRKVSNFLYSILGLFIAFVPMLIFEMNNHWFNTRNIFYYLTMGKNAIYVPNRWLFYVRDFWPAFWSDAFGIPTWLGGLIILTFGFLVIWLMYKRKLSKNLFLLLVAFGINFFMLRYYWGPRFFGYLNFLRPFVFIFTTYVILNLKSKKIYSGLLLIPLILFFSYPRIVSELRRDSFSTQTREKVNKLEEKYLNKKFTFLTCEKQYKGYYNTLAFSMLLILEEKGKISQNGVKIAFERDCDLPKTIIAKFPILGEYRDILIRDFSSASNSAILEAGWKPLTFVSMYKQYARWWFELQP